MNFFELLQEMKFDAITGEKLQRISPTDLANLVHRLAIDAFGQQSSGFKELPDCAEHWVPADMDIR